MKYLKQTFDTVFIMLGNNCNLNCEYCLQHPLITKELPTQINNDIYDFLYEISINQSETLILQFYGGEPLLYFTTIQKIIQKLETQKILYKYSIITNGKLLDNNKINFFNTHNFHVSISTDGSNSNVTRHYNVLQDKHDLIMSIKDLSFAGVISNLAYPNDVLNGYNTIITEYYDIYHKDIKLIIDYVMDTGLTNSQLTNFDYTRLYNEISNIVYKYLLYLSSNKDNIFYNNDPAQLIYGKILYNQVINTIHYNKCTNNNQRTYYLGCGNGYNTLNLDLKGNLYYCHNTSKPIGTIYDNYFAYLSELIGADSSIHNILMCNECNIASLCGGGCKILETDIRKKYYCKMKQTIYSAVINQIINFSKGHNNEIQ